MSQSDLGKNLCDFFAEEKVAARATVPRPAILDESRPTDQATTERWDSERGLAEENYLTALLRKDSSTLSDREKTFVGRCLVLALKEQ
jgi:hypothetical protein